MAEVDITISGRTFTVACQDGEEDYLHTAAGMLDAEAARLGPQAAQLTEARVLLMAGLMLADRTASVEDQLRDALAGKPESATADPAADAARIAELEASLTAKQAEVTEVSAALNRAVDQVEMLVKSTA